MPDHLVSLLRGLSRSRSRDTRQSQRRRSWVARDDASTIPSMISVGEETDGDKSTRTRTESEGNNTIMEEHPPPSPPRYEDVFGVEVDTEDGNDQVTTVQGNVRGVTTRSQVLHPWGSEGAEREQARLFETPPLYRPDVPLFGRVPSYDSKVLDPQSSAMLSVMITSNPELAAGWSLESGAAREVEVTAATVFWETIEAQGAQGVQDMIDQARPDDASPGTVSSGGAGGTSVENTGEEMTVVDYLRRLLAEYRSSQSERDE